MKKLKVKLTFTESLLGTSPADAEIYSRFIGAKSPEKTYAMRDWKKCPKPRLSGRWRR